VPIHKLGHCGYVVKSIDESCDFYTQNFNLKPSDVILGQNEEVDMIFLHVDLGKEYSEHHSFFIIRPMGPQPIGSPHHAAFEVESLDTTFVGHEYLKSKGYTNFWGVGRHIESSQVFDYWLDLDGFLLEHYADGDLVNEDHPISWIPPRPFVMTNNWGPGPDFSVLAPPPTVA
jgi:catechol 2,3-dioxygenase-like lactoylglutathione lyase family enzyme